MVAESARIDVHQHVWTEPLLAELSARTRHPFVRREHDLTVLHLGGERPYVVDCDAEAPAARAALVRQDGLDLAVLALSSPIGIETLPRPEAERLIDAHLAGVFALGDAFAAWGPVPLDAPDSDDVDDLLDRGCVGISLPAPALTGADALAHIAPVLERVALRGVPLFVHPGPAAGAAWRGGLEEPLWWVALTDYVAQMQAAWLSFATLGHREHPELTVLFAMLAGGAPLLSERLEARGGPVVDLRDPRVLYETSSYGGAAIDAMARRVGRERLLYGSDRPVVEPQATGLEALLQGNAARALAPTGAGLRPGAPA